jgi:hypothetical protein
MFRLAMAGSVLLALPGASATGHHEQTDGPTCSLRIELVDADTNEPVPGLIEICTEQGQRPHVHQLLDRGLGLPAEEAIHHWHVLARPMAVQVSQGKYTLRAFSGLETEMASVDVDVTGQSSARVRIPLKRFYAGRQQGWQAANTHVHLRKTTRPETDRYLIECSKADGLDVVFVSYLERPSEHDDYSTNKYTRRELQDLSNAHTHFDHGEEHRHNFTAWEEGYGHVMLLNIPELIHPVSIGPGITDGGTDGTPIRSGISQARAVGGRVIWCHNNWGLEDIPNWLSGRLDANNIFDGGTHGSYQHSFYRYLNVGLRVPFSTGTDWFMYDFSRVYVRHDQRLSPEDWLAHLASGKSYITNGPLLEFSVAGKTLGQDVSLDQPGDVRIVGRGVGRVDFERLELVCNGRVIETAKSRDATGHFRADLDVAIRIDEPCWLALRTPPPSAPDQGLTTKTPLNEYGRELFSHTSATFVDVAGKRVFDRPSAENLLSEMKENQQFIARRGKFADDDERRRVLDVYDQAIEKLATQHELAQPERSECGARGSAP